MSLAPKCDCSVPLGRVCLRLSGSKGSCRTRVISSLSGVLGGRLLLQSLGQNWWHTFVIPGLWEAEAWEH